MKELLINSSTPYTIMIGDGIRNSVGSLIREKFETCRVLVVTDSNVAELYLNEISIALEAFGFSPYSYVMPSGEKSKSIETYCSIMQMLQENGFTRYDMILALGGGVVGDVAGFVASTYMRGLSFIQVPTSLLAAIDSSVGGKTAIDFNNEKNLVGSFWQPSLVICDYSFFSTLPQTEIINGIGECIKYAILDNQKILSYISKGDYSPLIFSCLSIKKNLIEKDVLDLGCRHLLNLGHTIGHAIEVLSNYSIPHGLAVSKGLLYELKIASGLGYNNSLLIQQIQHFMHTQHIDYTVPFSWDGLYNVICRDKKVHGSSIDFIIAQDFGKCFMEPIPLSILHALMEKTLIE